MAKQSVKTKALTKMIEYQMTDFGAIPSWNPKDARSSGAILLVKIDKEKRHASIYSDEYCTKENGRNSSRQTTIELDPEAAFELYKALDTVFGAETK